MRQRQKVSRAGIELIKSFEGLRRKAARLPDGGWTIGYGHTRSAREGAEVTDADAEALLLFDLMGVTEAVSELVFTPLTQNQFDALAAFAFNAGVEALRSSDVLKRVNEGRLTEAACALDLWRRAEVAGDPIVLDALIRRRSAEKALFLTPEGGYVATPSPLVRPLLDTEAVGVMPTSRPVEIETPLEGDTAEIHRVAEAAAPEPEAAAVEAAVEAVAPEPAPEPEPQPEPVVEAAPEPDPQPEPVVHTAPEPSPEPVTPEPEPEVVAHSQEAMPEAVAPALEAVSYFMGEEAEHAPETTAEPAEAPVAETHAEPEAPPAEPAPVEAAPELSSEAPAHDYAAEPVWEPQAHPEPAPEPTPEPAPAVEAPAEPEPTAPAPRERVLAEMAAPPRLYSAYGPMGVPALGPPPPTTAYPIAPRTGDPQRAEPSPPFGPPAVANAETLAEISEPASVTPAAMPTSEPLVLTPPPEDWEPPHPAAFEPSLPGAEPHADQAPLFEDAWGGGANQTRIVREEELLEPEMGRSYGSTGMFVLQLAVGFTAFAGAVAAFLKGRAGGTDGMTWLAWGLALMGVGCVSMAVYFLLKRLDRGED